MHEHTIDLLSLCLIEGLNWHQIAREAQRPGGMERLLDGRLSERSKAGDEARELLKGARRNMAALRAQVQEIVAAVLAEGTHLVTVLDDDYPLNLRSIFNLPPFLFYRGELHADEDARSVAVVGTRKPSEAGVRRARRMAQLLAENKVTVLSGLALGIDTAAHEAALASAGRTVAVLGSGIRRIYPRENALLTERIVERGGALVSQFWPDTPPATYTFPRRNVTMSGMGQGTVVIEASSTSGAKMQARLALEHGKKVFLIHDLVAKQDWAKKYVGRGAVQVKAVEDILRWLRSSDAIRTREEEARQLSLALG